ncbi:hypothetical protein ABB37_08441 [Leptomonas pyrrhocoris]|uniref:Uncharacterized protein n=1 Tax=Leptomonas pyrrhocoris TaxID=157538 RepID=A0A0M9FT63_LEPPY|nr:hypothetical protein ABB37_08441 [Leptomonas pyrrhocoris]KPA75555.1 hypothetical protein ABB37_08441 [Leptomonas pyrrhocoris]|eukprot:XP_015653994.1 hypothetical protein ABB37_08441 [Leptomonas pyrrhocoris]
MRAVKMRNDGHRLAVEVFSSHDVLAADGAAQDCHHPAAGPASAAMSLLCGSKGSSRPPLTQSRPNSGGVVVLGDVENTKETQLDYLNDADSPCAVCRTDPLAHAFARDAPLTFTARDEPLVVARIPLHFHEMLSTIDQQLQYRQRQAAHQDSVDAAPLSPLPSSSPPRPRALSDAETPAPVSDFIRERLPLAVGRVPGCRTKMTHPSAEADADGDDDGDDDDHHHAAAAAAAAAAMRQAQELTAADEQRIYGERVAEEVLEYLLCPSSSRCRNAAEEEEEEEEEDAEHASNRPPQQRHRHLEDERRYAMVEACLSGLREIPSDSVEYGEMLRRLVRAADARVASTEQQQQRASQSEPEMDADVEVDVPAYVRQLLIGCAQPDSSDDAVTDAAAAAVAANNRAASPLAGAEPRVPVVTSTLRATLDALLPPRMLLYYMVDYEVAVEVQQQRQTTLAQQALLRQALQEHPNDRQSRAELAECATLLTEEYAQAPIGVMLVVLERTSEVQAPREYLKRLEQSLEQILAQCHARCCGRPLTLSSSAQNAQQQPTSATAATKTTASVAFTPKRPADAKPTGEKGLPKSCTAAAAAAAAGPTPTTTVIASGKDPVCTRTTRPPPARPTALSSSGGGSASVATTLNVLELNKERRLVQFDLLGEELLRQVTVDLPERGVLLRRLLGEAQLSLAARGVVARERLSATQEHLLDGQDDREELAAAHARLEAEAAQLRDRLTFLQVRKAGLEALVVERKARAKAETHTRMEFQNKLRERLTAHTEAMKAAQDAARQSALA